MDEYDDPEFDRLGASVLDQLQPKYPKQPVPQKQARPGTNAILVNARQKGNGVLDHIKNVPWEWADIQPDFVIGATACALYISLEYHRLHPEYLYGRIRDLGKQFNLRVMLVKCDIPNFNDTLKELTKTCIVNNFTLIVAWSSIEAASYLESFKSLEKAPAKEIRGAVSTAYADQLVDALTSIRSINKNDAYSLVGNFGSLKQAFEASPEELQSLGGWGTQKVKNYINAINLPFSTNTGTSKQKQEEILARATQSKRNEFNGEFGPGKDHSAHTGNMDPAHIGPQLDSAVDLPSDQQLGGSANSGTAVPEANALLGESETNIRGRKVNPEYQGTLDILAKMREASGYGKPID